MALTETLIGSSALTTCTLTTGAAIGELVVVSANTDGVVSTALTDNGSGGSNSYTRTINIQQSGSVTCIMGWTVVTNTLSVGSVITLAASGATGFLMRAIKLSPVTASPLDGSHSASGVSAATFDSGATLTTANADDGLVGQVSDQSTGTPTDAVVSPVWSQTAANQTTGGILLLRQVWREVSSTGTFNYNGTFSPSDLWAAGILAFKASGGVAAGTVQPGFHAIPFMTM